MGQEKSAMKCLVTCKLVCVSFQGKNQTKEPETPLPPAGPVATDPKGCVTIAIHAKPGSKQNAVTGTSEHRWDSCVGQAVTAPSLCLASW